MKYLLSLVVITILLLPAVSLIRTGQEIRAVKREMKHLLISKFSKEALELKIHKKQLAQHSEFIFHEDENELEIRGHMYDIISISDGGDEIIFKCVSDTKESKLKSELHAHLSDFFEKNSPQKKQTSKIFAYFKSLFVSEIESEIPRFDSTHFSQKAIFPYTFFVSKIDLDIHCPPPRIA